MTIDLTLSLVDSTIDSIDSTWEGGDWLRITRGKYWTFHKFGAESRMV